MAKVDVIKICEKVLERLSIMDYERTGGIATEQLIFPNKFPSKKKEKEILEKELLNYVRISEQELRQLFIEEFLKEHSKEANKLYYSIETPTQNKYKFGKTNDCIKVCKEGDIDSGQSALLDMCVFEKGIHDNKYKRILNIEFKHQNAALKNLTKDVLKLMHEEQNGAFVILLKNTNIGTLCNSNKRGKGIFNKFKQSFDRFNKEWCDTTDKSIQLIIISLDQNTLIHHEIKRTDNFDDIFSFEDKFGNIEKVGRESSWQMKSLSDGFYIVAEDELKNEQG